MGNYNLQINSINVNVELVGPCEFRPVKDLGMYYGSVDGFLYLMPMLKNGMPCLDSIGYPTKEAFNSLEELDATLAIINKRLGTKYTRDSVD